MIDEAKQTWTIDDKEYELDALSDAAKSQIVNIRVVDQEISKLQQQLAIMQTARNAYSKALKEEIAEKH
jgi:hypothetical protein